MNQTNSVKFCGLKLSTQKANYKTFVKSNGCESAYIFIHGSKTKPFQQLKKLCFSFTRESTQNEKHCELSHISKSKHQNVSGFSQLRWHPQDRKGILTFSPLLRALKAQRAVWEFLQANVRMSCLSWLQIPPRWHELFCFFYGPQLF